MINFKNWMGQFIAITCLFLLSSISICAQETVIKGKVLSDTNEPSPGAYIQDKISGNTVNVDENGFYRINVKPGKNTLICSQVGYLKKEIEIEIKNGETKTANIILEDDPSFELDNVVVLGKSDIQKVKESGFNVVAIDATQYHNVAVDLTQILDRASGVKVQQEGGVGSATNVNINGLSGRHVRFFIDGMPMDAMSPAFQVNNLPINLAERIEVYKGVVPVNFGSDALGGAVNIVTKKTQGTYVDATYSFGSFNTHKTYVNAGYTSKSGFTAQISAFQNYSDNNYYVDVSIKDFETNLLSKEPQRVRRFHDVYHNETVIAKIGLVNKTFADQLLFGFTLGQEYDEIQHPAYLNLAFGEKYQTSDVIMPSFLYSKRDFFLKELDFNLAANYNFGGGHNVDVSDREYNWLGESVHSNSLGEIQYSDYVYKTNNGTINANLNYKFNDNNRFTLNNVANFYARKGDERVAVDDFINQEPRVNNRNILGASYNSDITPKLSTSVFGKMYHYHASAFLNLSNQNGIDNFQTVTRGDTKYGYGFTSTYFIKDHFQLKANYELTCRLPVSEELFGEVFGFYEANFDLKPETSNNFNLGFINTWTVNQNNVISTDVNGFYRKTNDFIRRDISYSQGEGIFENVELVKTWGVDAELRYSYRNNFNTNVNITYLQPKNYTPGTYYKGILPNQPNFYANLSATYLFNNLWTESGKLSIGYNLNFVDEFLYDYDTYQASNRATVPTQFSNDITATYSWDKGKYNLSIDCKNIFDENLYDNYSLQKPGRSFTVKLRYFLSKI
ncbi:TonB-dependent receptor [Flavobacterium adhaerens]|uniref:TonB-dependent receptor n=1 Tax=Flavobacterium adhaerens TaxID=3149043 RepID=UPI0032B620EC